MKSTGNQLMSSWTRTGITSVRCVAGLNTSGKKGMSVSQTPKSLKYLRIRFVDIDGHPKMACVECEPNRPEPRYDRKMVDRLTKNMFGL